MRPGSSRSARYGAIQYVKRKTPVKSGSPGSVSGPQLAVPSPLCALVEVQKVSGRCVRSTVCRARHRSCVVKWLTANWRRRFGRDQQPVLPPFSRATQRASGPASALLRHDVRHILVSHGAFVAAHQRRGPCGRQ